MSASSEVPARADLHGVVAARLAPLEQRYTANRRQLVAALAAADGPLTLPELLARDPALAQSSAYRNLALLEEAGVVRRLVHGNGHARYELTDDLSEHHHHLICDDCGTVVDVTLPAGLEQRLDAAFDDVATASGFAPARHAIDIFGRCADCRR